MKRPSHAPLAIGVTLVIAGWAVLLLGWYQAGQQDLETGQIPYVISGGFGGFGLLLMGAIAVLVDVVRQSEFKLRRSAEELHGRMEELAERFVVESSTRRSPERGPGPGSSAGTTGSGAARPRRRRRRRTPQQRSQGARSPEE